MDCCKKVCLFLAVIGWASFSVKGQPVVVHNVNDVINALVRANRVEVSIDFTKCSKIRGKTADFVFGSQMDGALFRAQVMAIVLTVETSVNYNITVPVTRTINMVMDYEGSVTVFLADIDFTANTILSQSDYVCWIGKGAYFVRSTSPGAPSDLASFVRKSQEGKRFGMVLDFIKCDPSSELKSVVTFNNYLVFWEIRDYHFNEKGGVVFTKMTGGEVFTKMSFETSRGIYRATHKVTMNPDGSADIVYMYTTYKETPTAQRWHCPAGSKAVNLFELRQRY